MGNSLSYSDNLLMHINDFTVFKEITINFYGVFLFS